MAEAPRRPRDADATRRALLDAAAETFDALGYAQASTRAIASRAGVDPALIKRYFGGKEGLYLAALREVQPPADVPIDGIVAWAVAKTERRGGSSPIARATLTADPDEDRRAAVAEIMAHILIEPLTRKLEERGVPDARLRAELATSVMNGAVLARDIGILPTLGELPADRLVELLEPLVAQILSP